MKEKMVLYHGSDHIVETPIYGFGKKYNDYGQGFYCTENIELAREWSCQTKNNGYVNKYLLDTSNLNIMYLTRGNFNILNWLALLLANRHFDIGSNIAANARNYLISNFMPDTNDIDVIVGYRADDSYFSFAQDFINNSISLRDLNTAMKLGKFGEQIVLISEKSFKQIEYVDSQMVDFNIYYFKRVNRDQNARLAYANNKNNLEQLKNDIYVLDIIREGMLNDDPRLQSNISR